MAPGAGLGVVEEDRFGAGGGGDFAELGAGELEEKRRLGGAAEALEDGEDRKERGRRRGGEIEFDLHRDRIAHDGGGEVGGEVKTKHVAREAKLRE